MRFDARRVVISTLTVLAVAAAFWLFYALRGAWFLLFAGLVVGTAVRPLVQQMERARLSRTVAGILLHALVLAALLGVVVLLAPFVSEQLSVLAARLPGDLGSLQQWLNRSRNPIVLRLAERMSLFLSSRPAAAEANQVSSALGVLMTIGRAAITGLLLTIVGFFWMLDGEAAVRSLLRLVPVARRAGLAEFIATAEARVGAYVRGQLLVCIISATLLSVAYFALRLPYALVLGLSAGALEAVPLFGPLIGALPATLVAFGVSPTHAIWAVACVFGNHLLMSYLVAPRIIGRSVGVSPFVVLFSISAFGSLLGVAGAVLAIPIAAVLQLFLDVVRAPTPMMDTAGRDRVGRLRLRARDLVLDVEKLVGSDTDVADDAHSAEAEDLTEAIARDLERLLGERAGPEIAP